MTMSLENEITICMSKFVSNTAFTNFEFKDLLHAFITINPKYRSNKFYQKIYRVVRKLEDEKLIIIDKKTCNYRYTSLMKKQNLCTKSRLNKNKGHSCKTKFDSNLLVQDRLKSSIIDSVEKLRLDIIKLESELQKLKVLVEVY